MCTSVGRLFQAKHHPSTFQTEHYKLDWHRFNLRLKISGMPPVTAEEFERKTGAGEETGVPTPPGERDRIVRSARFILAFRFTGDMSSISGSESDSEEEDDDSDSESRGTSSNVPGTANDSSAGRGSLAGRHCNKVVFQNSAEQYLSVYRCILRGQVRLGGYGGATLWVNGRFMLISCDISGGR